jgi:hypothetical protein
MASTMQIDCTMRRERDWAKFRSELALPNSAHRDAGRFEVLLYTLQGYEERISNGGTVSKQNYHTSCNGHLFMALFWSDWGIVLDPKRRCAWALNLHPVSFQPTMLLKLPRSLHRMRCADHRLLYTGPAP